MPSYNRKRGITRFSDTGAGGGSDLFPFVTFLANFEAGALTDVTGTSTITANGDAAVSTNFAKFGAYSLSLDGTGDYVNLDGGSEYAFSTDDFTIEAFIRPTANTDYRIIYDFRANGANNAASPVFGIDNSSGTQTGTAYALYYFQGGSTRISGTTAVSDGAWQHVAVSRYRGETRMFLNGTQEGSTYTDATNYVVGASRPAIGAQGATPGSNEFFGNMDEIRIITAVGLYSANFTPPTKPFPTSS